jgi:RimJ/RimL family protein N-acetyltransferase
MAPVQEKKGRLSSFERFYGPVILGWVGSDQELFWLAPRTPPPLTVEKIEGWTGANGYPCLLWGDDARVPVGYGEINHMPHDGSHWWLGHLIVAPRQRGQGWGQRLVMALLERGFVDLRAGQVSLVVFPENRAAIRCYERCGMRVLGDQYKEFGYEARRYRMIHMGLTSDRYFEMLSVMKRASAQEQQG